MSRFLWSKREGERTEARNEGTFWRDLPDMSLGFAPGGASPGLSFRDVFCRNYIAVRTLLGCHPEPGVGVVVASRDGLEGSAWFEAKENDINTLIIGRHGNSDVFLPSDAGLSLRHLAVILYRRRGPAPVRFRVLDLRTPTAFVDERGLRLEAVESQGPVLLRCASFAVLFFPTGGPSDPWPEEPDEAWTVIPARLYLESTSADPARWQVPGWARALDQVPVKAREWESTLVHTFPGPVFLPRIPAPSDSPRGEILVTSPFGRTSVWLGASASRRGVLLGRYERCDTAGLPVLASGTLSRVHLLILEVEGALYAVDTASCNGSWLGAHRVRTARLEPGLRLTLAGDATVEWRSFH